MSTPNEEEVGSNPLLDSLYASIEPAAKEEDPKQTRGRTLHETLAAPDPEPKPPADSASAAPASATVTPPAAPAAAAPTAPVKRVKVRRAAEPAPAPAPAPVAAAPVAAPAPEPKDEEADLLDEEKDRLRIARFAAKKNPAKYADQDKKLLNYFKAHAAFVAKKEAEDPEYDFSDDNPEYKAFQAANRPPAIPAFEERAMEREMMKEEAIAAADERIAADREVRRIEELKPKLKKEADQFWHECVTTALPDNLMESIKTHGSAKARELHPLEYEVADHVTSSAATAMNEFLELSHGVKQFDKNNPQHIGIAKFIEEDCELFITGGQDLVRDGKQFVSRADFHSMPAAKRGQQFWTFSDKEMIGRARLATKFSIQEMIKTESARRAAQGWTAPTAAAPAPKAPQVATESSAARPTQAAGIAPAPAGDGGGNVAMTLLGY